MLPNFQGRTVAIIGGGPSLKDFDLSRVPGSWTRIAVNNSYQLVPDSDLLFFADARWYEVHRPNLVDAWRGRMVSSCSDSKKVPPTEVLKIAREYNAPYGTFQPPYDPKNLKACKVAGRDSGTMAVNFAAHCGAREIVLFGFDMTWEGDRSHWHEGHQWPTTQARYEDLFAPILSRLAAELRQRGVRVTRATQPGLSCIPFEPLESQVLRDIPAE